MFLRNTRYAAALDREVGEELFARTKPFAREI